MGRRYSDISRGTLLAEAEAKRRAWNDRTAAQRAAAYAPRGASSPLVYVLVTPFTHDLATGVKYLVRTNERNNNKMKGQIGTHATDPTPTSQLERNGNFTPAKIHLFVKTGSAPATSKVTGLHYTKSKGEGYSHPFGRAATADKEYEVFNAIAGAYRSASAGNRVTYSAEKMSQES